MSESPQSRQSDVLVWLDAQGSAGRELADAYRREHGLDVLNRCVRCNTSGGYRTCPEADRGTLFSCSNYDDRTPLGRAVTRMRHAP